MRKKSPLGRVTVSLDSWGYHTAGGFSKEAVASRHQQDTDTVLPGCTAAMPAFPSPRPSLAIPRRGHVLTTVAEEYGRPVLDAVAILTHALKSRASAGAYQSYISRRVPEPGAWVVRSDAEMMAWTLVSAWLTGFTTRTITGASGLRDAARWFFGGALESSLATLIPERSLIRADAALAACGDPAGYLELLPYVLDPHGPGSRLSIRRNARTRAARDKKRAEGVYYTPSDVAAYMVRECLEGIDGNDGPPAFFDPACGTAVFLRAALASLKEVWPDHSAQSLAQTRLYGTDIDPWALDAAAFVLLADCLIDSVDSHIAPLPFWHRLRLNFACIDALRLDPPRRDRALSSVSDESSVFDSLAAGRLPTPDESALFNDRVPLSQLFTFLPDAPLIVIGNPPYTVLGDRDDYATLSALFAILGGKAGPTSEVYPLFVEQMVRLVPDAPASGALVLPLSLACNIGGQFARTRALVEKTAGTWRFAFFDREPHALFGEDIKTRNTILLWHRDKEDGQSAIKSGPLRKWRGDSRAEMFTTIRFTPVTSAIRSGIPKIDGAFQAHAVEVLAKRWDRFEHASAIICRMPLAQALKSNQHTVFAGATAYNFLNVFLKPPSGLLETVPALSEHPLHAMDFPTEEAATAAFALLSSHLVYWWWHVTGDGFHVTRRFLAGLPFGVDALSDPSRAALAACGKKLWSLINTAPIISVNRGRTSLAFSPNGSNDVRREIDQILVGLAGLESAFVEELQRFTAHTIKAALRTVNNT